MDFYLKQAFRCILECFFEGFSGATNLVSDPYQHIIKDFFNPRGSISVCRRLEKPKEYTKKSLDIAHFFRVMVSMPPKIIPFWSLLVACNKTLKILLKPFQSLLKKT